MASDKDFKFVLGFVRKWEGGWADDKFDPGGLTRFGVTLKALIGLKHDVNKDGLINRKDLEDLSEPELERFYHEHYWLKSYCDKLPNYIAFVVFDSAVNQGPKRAVHFLQRAARVKVDGVIGPITLSAIDTHSNPEALLRDYCAYRAVHYSSLSHVVRYGLGWFRRLFGAHGQALRLLVS